MTTVDQAGVRGSVESLKTELEQGIPIWMRVGSDGPLLLVGWVMQQFGEPAEGCLARFFRDAYETAKQISREPEANG